MMAVKGILDLCILVTNVDFVLFPGSAPDCVRVAGFIYLEASSVLGFLTYNHCRCRMLK